MNNSNALAEIQSKYPNCNLLLPSATSVQINPFYKCSVMEVVADTAPNSGDIFSVGKVKTGEDGKGKAIYEDVFSPAKPLLMKLATAAGIQFHPEYTTVTRENTNTYVGKAYGAVRLPDGSYKTHMETKRICLDDEESKYRLEFMDKSIMGIHDWRAAKAASEMFKGEWKDDPEKINQWGKPEKYYVIADSDREKYIERSILVNMTLLRKTASEKAQTGAILRVIRALLGIKGTYSKAELEKPFVVPTVTFAPDYTDPTVRSAMLQQGMNSMGNMFGASSTPPAISLHFLAKHFRQTLIRRMKLTILHLLPNRLRIVMGLWKSRKETGSIRNSRHRNSHSHSRQQMEMKQLDISVMDVEQKSTKGYMSIRSINLEDRCA